MFDVYPTPTKILLIMEFCNAGDLHDFMCSHHSPLSEGEIRHFLGQIGWLFGESFNTIEGNVLVSGMKVLHSKNIIHRDLKPQNLLLHGPLNCGFHSPYRLCLKIADFGVARYLAEDAVAETVTGTPLYMAPELLVAYLNRQYKGRYSANVDMWSVGVILYECLTGERPFKVRFLKSMCILTQKNRIGLMPVTRDYVFKPLFRTTIWSS